MYVQGRVPSWCALVQWSRPRVLCCLPFPRSHPNRLMYSSTKNKAVLVYRLIPVPVPPKVPSKQSFEPCNTPRSPLPAYLILSIRLLANGHQRMHKYLRWMFHETSWQAVLFVNKTGRIKKEYQSKSNVLRVLFFPATQWC